MFDQLHKNNWRDSPSHLLLLSKFRVGDSPGRYRDAGYWEVVLQEKPLDVIQQFLKEGVIEPADLKEVVGYKFKTSDLKLMLKARGLKVSGRKEELLERLIENDASAMRDATKGIDVYRCTTEGMELAEHYLESVKAKREAAEREVLDLLASEEYLKAVRVVAQYEASQVFSRGLGVDWKNYDGTSDVESLRTIFNAMPAILKGIDEARLRQLRLPAAMMLLWGTATARPWLPEGFETGIHLDGEAACRMLVFHAYAERQLRATEELGTENLVSEVEWSSAGDGSVCPECEKMHGKVFSLGKAKGMIPYAECTTECGCRCSWSPVVERAKPRPASAR